MRPGWGLCSRDGDLRGQTSALEVNLLGAARALEVVIPRMVAAGGGHVIGLSSLADALISPEAPGYAASKTLVNKGFRCVGGGRGGGS
jgi:short-subunit dehydrogenase